MNNDKNIDWIIDYFNDELSKAERGILEQKIEEEKALKDDFELIRSLLSNYDRLNTNGLDLIPDLKLESSISEKRQNKPVFQLRYCLRYAAVILVLLCSGILVWQNQTFAFPENSFVSMERLLQEQNIGDRIKAVNISYSATEESKVVEILIHTLKTDQSDHVRLAAANALTRYTDVAQVRSALIEVLEYEQDPAIQIALINTLADLKETRAIQPIDKILKDENVFQFVKEEAQFGKLKLIEI